MKKVGIIGYGNMGEAIAEGLKKRFNLIIFDRDLNKTQKLKRISVAENVQALVRECEVIILAVKPQDFPELLENIKNFSQGKLFLSIAAGISTEYIEKKLPGVRVVRVMPNLGIKIRKSVTSVSKGKSGQDKDLDFAKKLFSYLGVVKEIDESLMNKVTAVSGSGPGFIFYFLENRANFPLKFKRSVKVFFIKELKKGAEKVGFNREEAKFLAEETVDSSFLLLKKTKILPRDLRIKVASKGGTTEAGLKVMYDGGTFEEAIKAAVKRAEELAMK
ncbi:MAG: pyrroline-5-carboxylate reductase [Candidatus Omnitrophica bacterium]|nr:pyrroline-5-carboxylate reductase [Candidatus Omnitrophota bacterium]